MLNNFLSPKKIILCFLLVIFVIAVYIQGNENKKFEDSTEVGRIFALSLMKRDSYRNWDKQIMKFFSDNELHPKINELSYQDFGGVALKDDFVLLTYKRTGDEIVATYGLRYLDGMDNKWNYTVVLSPIGKKTWLESLRAWVFFDLPFGNKLIQPPTSKDKWLVTDFYSSVDLTVKEYVNDIKLNDDKFDNEFKTLGAEGLLDKYDKKKKYVDQLVKLEISNQINPGNLLTERNITINDYIDQKSQQISEVHGFGDFIYVETMDNPCGSCGGRYIYIFDKNNNNVFETTSDATQLNFTTNDTFSIIEPVRLENEPLCCPTKYKTRVFKWDGKTFIESVF